MSYIFVFGEGFGYIFFIIVDLIVIWWGLLVEVCYKLQIMEFEELQVMGVDLKGDNSVVM